MINGNVPDGWEHFRQQAFARSKIDGRFSDSFHSMSVLVVGLTEETSELFYAQGARPFVRENVVNELGDCFWHVAMIEAVSRLRAAWTVEMPVNRTFADRPLDYLNALGELSGPLKRGVWGMDFPVERFQYALDWYSALLLRTCSRHDVATSVVMSESIAKNHRRFGPDGFDPKAAMAKADEQ